MSILTGTLKALRGVPPINFVATSLARGVLRLAGAQPEFFVRHLPKVGTVSAALPGGRRLRFVTRGDDGIPNQIFWRGWTGYEPETVPLFFELARRSQTTFDVGAHVGTFSLLAAHANPAGRVFAFEPLPANFRRLQQNLVLNGLTNVQGIEAAVSNEMGRADFFTTDLVTIPDMSSLGRDCVRSSLDGAYADHAAGTELRTLTVNVVTLNQVAREHDVTRVDLVKIDAEGRDPQVLEGMSEVLRRDRPHLIVEVLAAFETGSWIESILEPLGYSFHLLTRDGPRRSEHLKGQPDGHFEWRNYLCTRLSQEQVGAIWSAATRTSGPRRPG